MAFSNSPGPLHSSRYGARLLLLANCLACEKKAFLLTHPQIVRVSVLRNTKIKFVLPHVPSLSHHLGFLPQIDIACILKTQWKLNKEVRNSKKQPVLQMPVALEGRFLNITVKPKKM